MVKLHHSSAGLLLIRNPTQIMIPLTKEITTLGRRQTDIILNDALASKLHAEIRREKDRFKILDLQSTHGVLVNKKKIQEALLMDQDVIEIGRSILCFFKDIHDFHGDVEITAGSVKFKEHPNTERTCLTTTQKLEHPCIELHVVQGPDKGKNIKFKKSHVTIGRQNSDFTLKDLDASRTHALLEVLSPITIFLRDLGSTNGTLLNGKKIFSEKIHSGDQISIAHTTIIFHTVSEEQKRYGSSR